MLGDLDLLWGCRGCLAKGEQRHQVMKDCSCNFCSVYLSVSNSLAQHTTPLQARQSRQERSEAEEEAWNPFTTRSPPLRFALSFALSVFLQHALLSVKEWIEEDQQEPLHRVMHILNEATDTLIFISQSWSLTHKLSRSLVALISHPWWMMQKWRAYLMIIVNIEHINWMVE